MTLTRSSNPIRLLATAAGLAVACGLGFGLARLTASPPAAPASAPAATPTGPVSLVLPAAYLAGAGIAVEPVSAGNLAEDIQAVATAHAAPSGEAVATATAAGVVVRLHKRLGDPVRAGEVVAVVESREAAGIAADRAAAEARAALARQVAAREQSLYEQKVSPRQDYETARAGLVAAEAEARRARTAAASARVSADGRTLSVTSPIAGRITAEGAGLGAFVQQGAELFRVVDPRQVQVEAAVPSTDAARIAVGDQADLVAGSGARLTAVVRAIAPTVDEQTRTATVVLAITGGAVPSAGETLQALIRPKSGGPSVLVIPDEAVQRIEGRDVVFARTATGFVVRPVIVGARTGGRAVIVSGVSAGQAIATRNAFLLKAELGKGAEEEE